VIDATPVALLLAGDGSTRPDVPVVTPAVLTTVPVDDGTTVPVIMKVAVPPTARSTGVAIEPVPLAALHDDPALAAHDHVTLASPSGTASLTSAPVASLGPPLLTTIVHVIVDPSVTSGALGVFDTDRSAEFDGAMLTDAVSLAGLGSIVALD
jgi:hypothetical protein